MAKVRIEKDEESGMLNIFYKCECGQDLKLITPVRPKRLVKCFDCQTPVAKIDEPVEKYLENLKLNKNLKPKRRKK